MLPWTAASKFGAERDNKIMLCTVYIFVLSSPCKIKNMKVFLCTGRSSVALTPVRSSNRSEFNASPMQERVSARRRNQFRLWCHIDEPKSSDHGLSADNVTPRRPSVGATELPTQGDSAVAGIDPIDYINKQLQDILKPPSTEDYLAVSAALYD